MIALKKTSHKTWQHTRWVEVLAILLGVAPIYTVTILTHLRQEQPYSLDDILIYTGVIAPLLIVWLLFLLRFLCGESFSDLNLKPARWWQDVLGGLGLAFLTLGTLYLIGPMIGRILPSEQQSGLGDIFTGLARDPLRLALFLGPVLAIGVAGFEELTRVFFLSRWWKILPGIAWRWLGVLLSALLFGLAHLYQGPAGVANTALSGLILGIVYLRFGRVWPLMISHYLHDALQFALVIYLIQAGVM